LRSPEFLLTPKQIRADREAAISSLVASVPNDPRLEHLRDAEYLQAESTMYPPGFAEQENVRKKSTAQLAALATVTTDKGYAFFGFADLDQNGAEYHRLYVMQKDNAGILQFVKGYKVSMGENGFGNRKDSGQTPVGLRQFEHAFMGMHGEVVDASRESLPHFKLTTRDAQGGIHHFMSRFDGHARMEPAAVITGRLTIDAERGIHFHVSNRTGYWQIVGRTKKWISLLGGPGSEACGRMAGVDFVDAFRYVRARIKKNDKVISAGTPIYIHATEPVMKRSRDGEPQITRDGDVTPTAHSPGKKIPTTPATKETFDPFDNRDKN
jgi:hypothetical protein